MDQYKPKHSPLGGEGGGSKGVFTGSFDPFTIGHYDIVRRALPLFDELTICVGYNEAKHCEQSDEERMENIRKIFADEPRIKVDSWNGLTVDYCAEHDIHFIVKGVRSVKDFEYERDQAEMNRHLSGVETILLYSDPKYSAVSSSLVKVLKSYGKDVTEFLAPLPRSARRDACQSKNPPLEGEGVNRF